MAVAVVLYGGEQRNKSAICEVVKLCAVKPWWRMAQQ